MSPVAPVPLPRWLRRTTCLPLLLFSLASSYCLHPCQVLANCDPAEKSWEGIPFITSDLINPPDTHGAAGPSGVLAVVNHQVRYYDKNGNVIWSNNSLKNFFGIGMSAGRADDPRAVYDPGSGRFFVTLWFAQSSTGTARLYVMTSKTSNPTNSSYSGPTASWCRVITDVTWNHGGCDYVVDYSGLAVDGQALYQTLNLGSTLQVECPPDPPGAQVVVIRKSDLIACTTPVVRRFPTPAGAIDLVPVSVLGASSPGDVAYFVSSGGVSAVTLWALPSPLEASSALVSTALSVPNVGGPGTSPQPSGCQPLPNRAGLIQGNAFWNNGALWTCQSGSSAPVRVHYYRILTNGYPSGAPGVDESGTLMGAAGTDAYAPAIGGNANGDVAVVFNQSAAVDSFVSICYTARRASDYEFRTPVMLKRSSSCYYVNPYDGSPKWGDYATVAADPSDNRFWVAGEWVKSSSSKNWGTWWGKTSAVPPAQVENLTVTGFGLTSLAVSWTEPAGSPCRFEMRYGSSPITEQNFDNSLRLDPPTPMGIPGWQHCQLVSPLSPCGVYYFAVKAVFPGQGVSYAGTTSGSTLCSGFHEAECQGGGFAQRPGSAREHVTSLARPEPNPAWTRVDLSWEIGARESGLPLDVSVYDLVGRRIRRLFSGTAVTGSGRTAWALDLTDGARVPPGTYYVRLRVGTTERHRTLRVLP